MPRPSIDTFRRAAHAAGENEFIHLLRWYRAVNGLAHKRWGTAGSYSEGIAELPDSHAHALLSDLRRIARNARHRRRALDGKPTFSGGRTLAEVTNARTAAECSCSDNDPDEKMGG